MYLVIFNCVDGNYLIIYLSIFINLSNPCFKEPLGAFSFVLAFIIIILMAVILYHKFKYVKDVKIVLDKIFIFEKFDLKNLE